MWSQTIFNTDVYHLYWYFILYSFFGWIFESSYCSLRQRRLINRGFVNGPFVPIYGTGAMLVYIVLEPFANDSLVVFIGGIILASVVEYITSWLMETIFNATWWDYSGRPYNLNGRICLAVSLAWGCLALVMVKFIQPAVVMLTESVPRNIGEIAGIVVGIFFGGDFIYTFISTMDLRKELSALSKIREEFKEYLISTRIYETKEAITEKFENMKLPSMIQWMDGMKEKLSESKLMEFRDRYEKTAKKTGFTVKRYLRSYPGFKSKVNKISVEDLKEYFMKRYRNNQNNEK